MWGTDAGRRYGDQALFFRREVFWALGGFPVVPLMEDYDLVQRVRELGGGVQLVPCEEEEEVEEGGRGGKRRSLRVITSARRWEEHGVLWTTVMNQVRA